MDLLNQIEATEVDALSSLEERIRLAIETIARLRRDKEAAVAERDAAVQNAASLASEIESLKAERRQVRNRIEKLLGQVESLSAM